MCDDCHGDKSYNEKLIIDNMALHYVTHNYFSKVDLDLSFNSRDLYKAEYMEKANRPMLTRNNL